MVSISRWKAWAAFLSPKGVRRNSKRPNGVITAVLWTSSGATGIWWYPRTRSILEKKLRPCSWAEKSCRCGTGYLSGVVLALSRRKSPQGRQDPSSFLTRWSGEDQALSDRRTIPDSSMDWNAFFAETSLSGESRLAFAKTGGPVVGICNVTPCLTVSSVNVGRINSG